MNDFEITRADPDVMLSTIAKKKSRKGGRLHLFIGMAPGVGKTFAMLLAGREAKRSKIDVVIGVVETHGRIETENLIDGLPVIEKKIIEHRDRSFMEMDIDAILARKPTLVLVDELAHTNIPGSRHQKRWQDVFELLDAGIDVYSTINIQHFESRKESVEKIANITISETVPDSVLDRAFQIQLIDLSVPDLLRRLKEGKVYLGDKAEIAAANFFKEEKLTALREIALRVAAERVDTELQTFATEESRARGAIDRLMVAVGYSDVSETLIRTTRKLAYNLDAPWIAVHVSCNELVSDHEKALLKKNLDLARNLGAEILTIAGTNVADVLIRTARQKDVTEIIVGRAKKNFFRDVFRNGSIADQLIDKSTINICVLGPKPRKITAIFDRILSIKIQSTLSSLAKAVLSSMILLALNLVLTPIIGYRSVGFILLLGILILGLFFPLGSVLLASIVMMVGWTYFFIPPVGTFQIRSPDDIFLSLSFLVAALATGVLTRRIKYQQGILANRELRVQSLNRILLDIAKATTTRELCTSVIERIQELFGAEVDFILLKKDQSLSPFANSLQFENESREMATAKWVVDNNKSAGRFTTTLLSSEALYIPLNGSYEMMGALAFRARNISTLSLEDMDFLFTVAHQTAISLEKQKFRSRALETDRLAESEQLQETLLNLVASDVKDLIPNNSPWLFSLENILLASRLSSGVFPLKKEPVDTKVLIDAAIIKAEQALGKPISHNVDGENFVVNIERGIVIQVMANILLNAAQNAPDQEISITLRSPEISVADRGPGLDENDLGHLFERFSRHNNGPGHGLGLSIAKGIIRAHEGKIVAINGVSGGLVMKITLPKL